VNKNTTFARVTANSVVVLGSLFVYAFFLTGRQIRLSLNIDLGRLWVFYLWDGRLVLMDGHDDGGNAFRRSRVMGLGTVVIEFSREGEVGMEKRVV
jgi:hypothetical protein